MAAKPKAAKPKFSGTITDKRGRKITYQDGKRVKGQQAQEKAEKKAAAKGTPAKKSKKGSPEAVESAKKAIGEILKGTGKIAPDAMVGHLDSLTVAQLAALHKEHGVKAPGKLRAKLVESIKSKMGKEESSLGDLPDDDLELPPHKYSLKNPQKMEEDTERMSGEKKESPIDEMPKKPKNVSGKEEKPAGESKMKEPVAEPKAESKWSSKASVSFTHTADKQAVKDAWGKVAGKLPISAAASLVGAPDDADVYLSLDKNGDIKIETEHKDYMSRRVLKSDEKGRPVIKNAFIEILNKDAQGGGLGSKVFSDQVSFAKDNGISYIETDASSKHGLNGFYTWPRLGYDMAISDMDDENAKAMVSKAFPKAKSILDVMTTKEGRDWWKKNGSSLKKAKFDLSNDSRSMKVMNSYLQEREAQKGDKNERASGGNPVERGGGSGSGKGMGEDRAGAKAESKLKRTLKRSPKKEEAKAGQSKSPYEGAATHKEKVDRLKELHLKSEDNPDVDGVKKEGPPKGLDMKSFGDDIFNAVQSHADDKGVGSPMSKLYESVGKKFNLSKRDFLRAVRASADNGDINLGGWPGTLDDVPDPEMTFHVSGKLMNTINPKSATVGDRRKKEEPKEPAKAADVGGTVSTLNKLYDEAVDSIPQGLKPAMDGLKNLSTEELSEVARKFLPKSGDARSEDFAAKEVKRSSRKRVMELIQNKILATYKAKQANRV